MINTKLIFLLTLILTLFNINNSIAADTVFYVDGMTCPFCTAGLEKKLKSIDGVSEVQITLKTGEVIIKSEKELTKSSLKEAVMDAGFAMRKDLKKESGK